MTLSETGVWLIPLILVASLVALFLFTRYWRKATHARLSLLRGQLRQMESSHRGLALQAGRYPPDSPEPFNKPAKAIHQQLEGLQTELDDFKAGYIDLQDKLHELNQNRFRALVAAPYLWNDLHTTTTRLDQQISTLQNHQQKTQAALDQLHQLPLEIAAQARAVTQLHKKVQSRLDQLKSEQVYGAILDSAQEEGENWRANLASIPEYFLLSDEVEKQKQADPSITAEVYSRVERALPALEILDQKVEDWHNLRQDAVRQVSQLQVLLAGIKRLLSEMPAALDLSTLISEYDRLEQVTQNLEATLGRLELESIHTLTDETLRQQQSCAILERELRQARQQLGSLNKTLPDLDAALNMVSEQFEQLSASPVHPIKWISSRTLFEDLSQKAAALQRHTAPYTPDQVRSYLETATQLLVEVKLLDQQTRATGEGHTELLKLLDSPELSADQRWLESARVLSEKITAYDPVNWPRLDGTSHLAADLDEFSGQFQKLIKQGSQKFLAESDIPARLEEARWLARTSAELRSRVIKIQTRLDEIQEMEGYCQQQLDEAARTLAQVNALERSNEALAKITHNDLVRLSAALEQAQTEVGNRQRGSIEKKIRVTDTFTTRLRHSLNQWQGLFSKEIETTKQTLAGQLTALQNIADLDEPALEMAKQLLASPAAHSSSRTGSGHENSSGEIVLELKRNCEFWQSCQAAHSGLQDVAQPIFELFQEASRHRTNARQMLANQTESLKGTEKWLSGSASLDGETQEFARLEATWNALRSQPVRAMALVNQLGKLAARYEGLAERIQQSSVKTTQTQAQLAQLETDLDELAAKWEALWEAYRDNPTTAEEIRKLLADIDGERDMLERQFRQGERSYGEVLHTLQQLARRARLTQVMIDERTALDINGRIIPYK